MNRMTLIPQQFRTSICIVLTALAFGCGKGIDGPAVTLERARILMERDQAAEAIPLLNEVVAALPKEAEALYQRGVAYESLDVLEKALADYTECLQLDRERTDALNNKAVVLAKLERFSEAAAEFTRLVELDPQGPLAYRNRGLCHFDLNNFDAALADYAKALELAPKEAANWFQRAAVYLEQKRYAEAELDYTKAIELDPELAKAWMNRGVVRYKSGQKALAAEDLAKAQELDDNIVLPDIGFFSDDQPAASGEASADASWKQAREAAEKELTSRGLAKLTLVQEFASFQCAEFSGELNGASRVIFVACCKETDELLTLPVNGHVLTNSETSDCVLLVLKTPADPAAMPTVSVYNANWDPRSDTSSQPVMMRYNLRKAIKPQDK